MLNDARIQSNNSILWRMKAALTEGQTETFMLLLKEIFAGLTYQQIERKESYFHSIFYLTVKLLGMEIESEVLTSFGRIDVVIKTRDYIYITEFKLGTATEALEQIRKMRYAEKYAGSGKQIILLGIGFDADQRTIGSWEDAAIY
ncbi:MAG: PD-(D/E)XK nuclease domain-containing protein [Mangrovibacterium sp.]